MIIEAKELINLPIAGLEETAKIGEINKIIADISSPTILGFLVKPNYFLSQNKVLSIKDIIEWDKNGLVTGSTNNLVEKEEIIRINNILNTKFDLFGLKAKTEIGKNLGFVKNFLIDTETAGIIKFFIKDIITGDRIFSVDKVVSINSKAIIFSDDTTEIPTNIESVTV